ncbi:MAG: penicillin acylase family protein, partial [Arenibacterium sp.]
MAMLFRWLLRIAGVLVVLVVLGVVLVYFLASQSLPEYDRLVPVSGVNAPVEIIRVNSNVPHTLGQTDAGVFFGRGYAHAQARF